MVMSAQDMRDVVTFHWPRNPYPGLRPFRDDEALIFYGRNSHKDEILARLNDSQLVFVTGPSGCGKSSLIRAGVLPALQAGLLTKAGYHWRTLQMRPGRRPLVNLAAAFESLELDAAAGPRKEEFGKIFKSEGSGLWIAASHIAPLQNAPSSSKVPVRLLLLIDQFEEIFGEQIQEPNDVDRFVRLLVRFAERPHHNLFVVVTMRSDYIGQCANFEGLAEIINRTQFLTPVLTQDELYQAITRPTEDYNGEVEEPLAEQIVRDMRTGTAYHSDNLPLMQHALLWMWSKAWKAAGATQPPRPPFEDSEGATKLTLTTYQGNGGIGGILDHHAEDVLREAVGDSPARGRIAEAVFRRLSERDAEGRYRRSPASAEEICNVAGCKLEELQQVIAPFEHPDVCFLEQRPSNSTDEILVDISHESLIRQWTTAKTWANAEAEKTRKFRELVAAASTWERRGRQHGFLKSRGELEVIQDWWRTEKPNPVWARRYALGPDGGNLADAFEGVEEYLRVSSETDRAERDALALAQIQKASESSRRQRNRVLTIAIFLLFVSAVAAGMLIWQTRQTNAYKAGLIALLATEALNTFGPTRGLLAAMEGIKDDLPDRHDIQRVGYRSLALLRERHSLTHDDAPIQSLQFSPKAVGERQLLMTTTNDGWLRFWDARTGERIERLYPAGGKSLVARWSPDGRQLFISPRDGQAFLLVPCASEKLRPIFPDCGTAVVDKIRAFNQVVGNGAFSPDGRWIITGGSSATTKLWWVASLAVKADFGRTGWWMGSMAFSHDSKRLALGSQTGEIRIFGLPDDEGAPNETPEAVLTPPISRPPQIQLAAGPEQQETAAQGNAAQAGAQRGSVRAAVARRGAPQVNSLAFHPKNSDSLLATLQDGTARLWRSLKDEVPVVLRVEQGMIFQGVFNHDGEWVATAHEDRAVRLWPVRFADAETYTAPRPITLRGHMGTVFSVAYDPDGILIASGSSDATARIWSQQSSLARSKSDFPTVSRTAAVKLQVSRVGSELKVKNPSNELTFAVPLNFLTDPAAAALSRSREHVVIVPEHGQPYLFNVNDREYLVPLPGRPMNWREVAFSEEQDRIIAVTQNGEAYSWPYFPDLGALRRYGETRLPLENGKRVQIKNYIACRIEVRPVTECPPAPDASVQ